MIFAGIGCRPACAAGEIVAALEAALASAGRTLAEVAALYAPAARADLRALEHAASMLGKRLELVEHERLVERSAGALTHSAHAQRAFGVPSVAETAALAGAHAAWPNLGARLLGPRVSSGGATCALAIVEET
ncbi:MAG TPA: cobalamin biosynthesis protein [Polyangiales bacterium]|nr:cobalamin biosynthesis protein [Polyangiales bacterium]